MVGNAIDEYQLRSCTNYANNLWMILN